MNGSLRMRSTKTAERMRENARVWREKHGNSARAINVCG